MTMLRERIDTTAAARATRSPSSPTSPTPSGGTRASRPPCATNPGRSASGRGTDLGVRMGGRVVPMDYEVTAFEPPHGCVVLEGRGRGVRAIDDIRFSATADGTRIDYIADIRLVGLLRLVAPFAGGALRARSGARRATGMQRALERPGRRGPEQDGRRDRRLRDQRPHGRLRAARGPPGHGVRAGARRRRPRRRRSTVDAPGGAGRGRHRVHRLQRADLSAVRRAARRARRRDAGQRHVVRLCVRRLRVRVQLARRARASFPTCGPSPGLASGGCSPTSGASTATRAPSLDDPTPTHGDAGRLARRAALSDARSATTSSCRSRRRSGRPRRTGSRSSRSTTCCASSTTTASSASAIAPQWRVVRGGSRAYVDAPRRRAAGRARCGPDVPVVDGRARPVRRDRSRPTARGRERFDAVDPGDPRRRRAAAARRRRCRASDGCSAASSTRTNAVVLHTDDRVLPANPRARASWNVRDRRLPAARPTRSTMTYHMNRLQSLPGAVDYCVSVNPGDAVRPDRVIVERAMSAIRCTRSARSRRSAGSPASRAGSRTWFAGAHLGYGFHEDGCRSGLRGGGR